MQKLKVSTPQTSDGKTLRYDEDNQPIYLSSFVEVSAKRDFESLNSKLPKHLRNKLEIVQVTKNKRASKAPKVDPEVAKLKKELEEAKALLKAKEDKEKEDEEKALIEAGAEQPGKTKMDPVKTKEDPKKAK